MTRGPSAPLTGRTLGDFTILEKLGEGGFGVVHRAEQRGLGREAVVKVLHARLGVDDRAVQRFLRESQLASRLDHPFAAHIYAFGAEPDGVLWIAMELVRGTPLSKVLASQPGGRMPLVRLVPLLDRICEVVHTAHEQGIVHRDLKPDNIMVLSRAGRLLPKLLDLGVARLTVDPTEVDGGAAGGAPVDPRLTQEGARVGSPFYMAPEQWAGGEIDGRTDLYALGVLTYEALAGKVPFGGATLAEIARGHLHGEVAAMPADVPEGVVAAIGAALAKSRDARPASVLVFAEAVRAAAGLRATADTLPRLDDSLRQDIAWLPQPLAEAVGALEAARNPHQARDGLWEIVHVAARWLGVIALMARTRVGPGPGLSADSPALVDLLRALPRRDLADDEWLELVRALVRPFAGARDAYPVPELVDLAMAEASPFAPLLALHATEAASTSEESLRDWLGRTLPVLAPLLRALAFLTDYQLVVAQGGGTAEVWMGPRKPRRAMLHVADGLVPGEAALVDLDGRPVLALAPLVAVAPPAPGAVEELFVFAGPGRARGRGARLVAEPHGFERHDDGVWTWFRERLLSVEDGGAAQVEEAPYRGLAAFTEKDAELFFGRERAAEAFVNQLLVMPLLAVVGPSGAGKSSFVQAGVVPRLPPGWRAIVLRPGATPVATLAARVDLSSIVEAANETLVIVVDQFEELFTLGADAAAREQFARALVEAAARDHVRVVLTLRDDFLVRAGELGALRDRLAHGLTLLATPAPDDLVRIVVEPARRAGYDFDDKDLPARMTRAVAGQPGALALLSFTAAQLWELRDRHFKRLTRTSYDAIGGVEGALAAHADAVLTRSSGDEQRLVRDAFRHLVTAEGTRAVVTRRELDDVLGGSAHAAAVIERLVKARLLVASESETGGDDRIEIIHEALITAWPRLVQWRRDDAEGARLRDQLRAAARQWADRDRARGLLWRDDALDDYRRWRARWPGALPELDEAFAAASLRDAARGRRIRRTLAATAATVLVGATIALSLLYRSSQHHATESHDRLVASYIEQGRRLLLDGDYLRALPYLSAAYAEGDDSRALRFMLHRAMKLADAPVFPFESTVGAFRDDAHIIAASKTGELTIREIATHRVVARLAPTLTAPAIGAVGAISANGARAAYPANEGVVVWDGRDSRILPVAHASRLAFDATGARLAISDGAQISAWNAATGARVWSTPQAGTMAQMIWIGDAIASTDGDRAYLTDGAHTLTLGPTGRLGGGAGQVFAGIGPDGVTVWSAAGAALRTIATPNAYSTVLSSDGALLAVVARTGAIELFDVATGQAQGVLAGHHGPAAVAFNPDGTRLVSVGEDHTVRIWDVRDRSQLVEQVGAASGVVALDFDASAARFLTASVSGVRIYRMTDPGALITIDAHESIGTSGFAPGDARIFTTTDTGMDLWSSSTGEHLDRYDVGPADGTHLDPTGTRAIVPLAEGTDAELFDLTTRSDAHRFHAAEPLVSARFDPSGKRVVTTGVKGTVEVWDAGGARVATLTGHVGPVINADVSPDGTQVAAVGYEDQALIVWDLATGKTIARGAEPDSLYTVMYDGSGTRLVTASDDRLATLWDARTLERLHSFEHESVVRAAAISRDGSLVAGGTRDGVIAIWDVVTGKEMIRFHQGSGVMSVDFARSGARVVSGSTDRTEVVWEVSADVPSPAAVVAFTRCHVPYALRGSNLEPIELTDCADLQR